MSTITSLLDPAAFQAPTPLLRELERSFKGKSTVAQCLRSKVVPAVEVVKVLHREKYSVDRSELHLSYCSILTKYLGPLKDASSAATAAIDARDPNQQHPSLYFMERIATICRFLQLLLEFKEATEPEEEGGEAVYVTLSVAGDAEVCKMILQLIRSLTSVICGALEESSTTTSAPNTASVSSSNSIITSSDADERYNATDCSEGGFDATLVAVFAFGSLLRLDHYCSSRPFLLSAIWKGLCEIATALTSSKNHTSLSCTLVQQAVLCLANHLQDGLESVLSSCSAVISDDSNAVDPNEQAFVLKILGFLVTRLTTFLKLIPAADCADSSAYSKAVQVLALLCGIGFAVETSSTAAKSNEAFAEFVMPYSAMAIKVEKCVSTWIGSSDDALTVRHGKIALLDHSELSNQWQRNETTSRIAKAAFYAGKSMLLTKTLEDVSLIADDDSAIWYQADVEPLLSAVEELMLRSLPGAVRLDLACARYCTAAQLLVRSMKAMSTVLVRIETGTACIATNATPGRARFHRLLVHWLRVSDSHPLSLHLAMTVVQGHISSLGGSSGGKAAVLPLLTLLVKLLFDTRTSITLRAIIASLLSRLLREKVIKKPLDDLLCAEYARFEHSFVPSKLKEQSTARIQRRCDSKDLVVILSVLSKVQIRIGCKSLTSINLLDLPRLSTTSVQAAAIHVTLSDFSSGGDYVDLVNCFIEVWNHAYGEHSALLAIAVLQQAHRICTKLSRGISVKELEVTLQLLLICTKQTVLEDATRSDTAFLLAPVFEAIRVLGVIGGRLLPTSPTDMVHQLGQCFYAVLSYPCWALRAHAITSLVQFASTVPSTHKNVLPTCLPKAMQKLLQCRLQGSVCGKIESLPLLRAQSVNALLEGVAIRRNPGSSIFPEASSITITIGSYFMTMPTQGGRNAVVIFPPGDNSLEDIRYMLGNDVDGENILGVQTLQHVLALPEGGCKLRLLPQ